MKAKIEDACADKKMMVASRLELMDCR
jgi:hypothetical protein